MAKKSKNWFQTGQDGWDRAKQEDEAAKARRAQQQGPWRFRIKNDSAAKITFLDTPKFFVHEHNLKLNGRWGNYFTCLKDFDTCPACEEGLNPTYVVVGTCIDHSTYTDREGNKHTNQKKLFVGKGRARDRLLKQIERRKGDLRGHVYEMSRGSAQQECATGEDFEHLGKLTKAKLKKLIPSGKKADWLEPFDYEELFEPLEVDELAALLGIEAPVGSESDSDDSDDSGPDLGDSDEFDEDEVREELEGLKTKTAVKKWAESNDLEIEFGPLKSTDKEEMIDQIIEAMAEAAEGAEPDDSEEEGDSSADAKDNDDLSIDDLI